MTDLILHHYPTSPFAEKIRVILGYKGMAWKSVFIPTVMPKPDLMPLTGGYRKTPVLQIGADIYCDTKLIARVIERLQPNPPLIPADLQGSISMLEQWTEQTLFFLMMPIVMQPKGLQHFFAKLPQGAMEYFQKDRQAMFSDAHARRPSGKTTASELPGILLALDGQLSQRPFLHGSAPTLADFSLYHPLWFVRSNPGVSKLLDPYPHLLAWYERITAGGHGPYAPMKATEALDVAQSSHPVDDGDVHFPDPNGLKIGDAVMVSAADYGTDPVKGTLVKSTLGEVAIRRQDERVGEVVVHFPRVGFRVTAQSG